MNTPSYADSIALLKQVFTPAILTDSARAKSFRGKEELNDTNGAWLVSHPAIYPMLDLQPPRLQEMMRELVALLYVHHEKEELPEDYATKEKLQHALVGNNRGFSCHALQKLVDDGVSLPPRFEKTVHGIMDRYLAHEQDWIAFRNRAVSKANHLLLGHAPEGNHHAYSFDTHDNLPYGRQDGFEVSLNFDELPGLSDRFAKDGQRSFYPFSMAYDAAIKQRGLENMFAFNSYHVGTHAPIDREMMILAARSNEHLVLQLDKLKHDPKLLSNARDLMIEFIGDANLRTAVSSFPSQYIAEANATFQFFPFDTASDEEKVHNRAQMEKRKAYFEKTMQTPYGKAWGEVHDTITKPGISTRDAWNMLVTPKPGYENASADLRAQVVEMFPLLHVLGDGKYPEATPIRREQPVQQQQARAAVARLG